MNPLSSTTAVPSTAARPNGLNGASASGSASGLVLLGKHKPSFSAPSGTTSTPLVRLAQNAIINAKSSGAKWTLDPFSYFSEYGYELVGDVMEQSANYGYNPQTVGKSRPVWSGLRGRVKLKRLELEQSSSSKS